ncbi:MAG: septum formation initiator family protein [Oscillospiraceae bacterium]|nr:septum formation initiator family protein [Oscillospiraceae bacterium]MCC8091520.1 septum formation initiator family protein [Oscillospiraceae bacterium]MCC8156115.1 septum formation initiator family protein [Oscillospiraceae bacterium]MCD7787274.1 septum formation initiator family protein [Oscillospiraceae bacterium]MCD7934621.1 septum formation initiator family protein [Oscillospiraceae bacterium]
MKLKRTGTIMKIVILAIIVYAVVTLVSLRGSIAEAETDQAALQAQVDAALQENAELEYDIEHADDPEVIAGVARSKLGLVLPGEKIYYDVSE